MSTFELLICLIPIIAIAQAREDRPECKLLFEEARECFPVYKKKLREVVKLVRENMPDDAKENYLESELKGESCEKKMDEYVTCCNTDASCYLYDEYEQLADTSEIDIEMYDLTGKTFDDFFEEK